MTPCARLGGDPARRPVLVALDFDGTLAPLQDDPSASRILPGRGRGARAGSRGRRRLDRAGVRALDERPAHARRGARGHVPHRQPRRRAGPRHHVRARPRRRPAVATSRPTGWRPWARRPCRSRVAGTASGWRPSRRPSSCTRGSRRTTWRARPRRRRSRWASSSAPACCTARTSWRSRCCTASKGEALVALRDELGASVVLYAGDDVTDEHAFEVLRVPTTWRSRWATGHRGAVPRRLARGARRRARRRSPTPSSEPLAPGRPRRTVRLMSDRMREVELVEGVDEPAPGGRLATRRYRPRGTALVAAQRPLARPDGGVAVSPSSGPSWSSTPASARGSRHSRRSPASCRPRARTSA